jgi:hypothetical protein
MNNTSIHDEAALLITCLRGSPFLIPPDMDWPALLSLASENGVLLLLYQSLLENNATLPESFAAAADECRLTAESLASVLENLLNHFAEHGIDVLPLKGPSLSKRLYKSETMRQSNDLDLLVRQKDYARAESLLLTLGFAVSSDKDDYHRRFIRNEAVVELHFGISSPRYFPFDLEGVWSRSRAGSFMGRPMRVMSDDDLALYLCLHGIKHGFSRLIWILDFTYALRAMQPGSYNRLLESARRDSQEAWLLIGCAAVREMFPQQLPQELEAAIATSPQLDARARRIADRLFREGLEVINDHKIRNFYLQMERSVRQRWLCRLSYFAPTAEDYRWAERHGISRKFAPALRPFRLLQKYGPSRIWRAMFPSAF